MGNLQTSQMAEIKSILKKVIGSYLQNTCESCVTFCTFTKVFPSLRPAQNYKLFTRPLLSTVLAPFRFGKVLQKFYFG